MTAEETVRLTEIIREISGDEYFLLVPGDATYGIPTGEAMMEFSCRLLDEPEKLKDEARKKLDTLTAYLESIAECKLIDGLVMCTDYCFNDNSFLSPAQFDEFVTPYLADQIKVCRDLGLYTIKHTDGNIMPILDSIVEANPHALHSLDPQGGIDMAEIKRLVGNKVCLVGNVNCGLMDTGTLEEALASASYALKHGMPGGGYIFSTSNCVYPGMSLERYEAILGVWQREGNYT
jgi:uroporphyrinogen decarboxylase